MSIPFFGHNEFYQLEPNLTDENIVELGETVAESEESSSENDEEVEEMNGDYEETNGSETVYDRHDSAEPNSKGDVDNEPIEEISFLTFAPLPQKRKAAKKTNRGRPKQLSVIMTSPAYKITLEEKRQKKIVREQKKASATRNKAIKAELSKTPAAKKPKKTSAKQINKIKTDNAEISIDQQPLVPFAASGNRTSVKKSGAELSSENRTSVENNCAELPTSSKCSSSTRKRRKLPILNSDKDQLSFENENGTSKSTQGVEASLNQCSDHQLASVKTTSTAKKRRVAVKEKSLQPAKPRTSSRKRSTKITEKSAKLTDHTGGNFQLNELMGGLCFLCGEKYQAEFFVCVQCNNCVHIGCSSGKSIVDEICSDCNI